MNDLDARLDALNVDATAANAALVETRRDIEAARAENRALKRHVADQHARNMQIDAALWLLDFNRRSD